MAEMALNIATDPAVVSAQANAQRIRQLAQATALRQSIEAASSLGDEGVLRSIEGISEEQIQAALANPFTQLKDIAKSGKRDRRGIDEGRNKQGLFFSSTRADDLGQSVENQQRNLQSAISGTKQQLGGIQDILSGRNLDADQGVSDAVVGAQRYQSDLYANNPDIYGEAQPGEAQTAATPTGSETFTFGGGKLAGQTFEQGDLSGVKQALRGAGIKKPTKYLSQRTRARGFFLA